MSKVNEVKARLQLLNRHCANERKRLEKQLRDAELEEQGGKPDADQAYRLRNQRFAYGVVFVRRKAGDDGQLMFISVREFGTSGEANHHGKRFQRLHKHKAFYVITTKNKPNAWVNWNTGKTNPVI